MGISRPLHASAPIIGRRGGRGDLGRDKWWTPGWKDEPVRVRDPVCGMTFEAADAVARERHEGLIFYFCAPGCAHRFRSDPDLYADSVAAPPAEGSISASERPCPACGSGTRVGSHPADGLGNLSAEEIETLVRNEWRRRLGRRRYAGVHPRAAVRWSLLAVLRPEEDQAPLAVAAALRAEAVRHRGSGPFDAEVELDNLMQALATVLRLAGRGPERVAEAHRRIAACLHGLEDSPRRQIPSGDSTSW